MRLDHSTLADWVGRATWHLRPVHERLLEHIRASTNIFADETRAPVLDPGRGRNKTGQLWAYARALISQKTKLAEAIRYTLSRWDGLTRFLDDGRVGIDSNVVERAIRPIGGAENWAVVDSLIETCKLNGADPQAYMADVLTKIIEGHLASKLDELIPRGLRAVPPRSGTWP